VPVLTALLAGAGCGDPATSPSDGAISAASSEAHTTLHFSDTEPIQGSVNSLCSGDVITYSGTLFVQGSVVLEPAGYENHGEFNSVINATVTGQPSDNNYVYHETEHQFFETPSFVAPNGVFMIHHTGILVSPGPGPDSRLMFGFTLVGTPNDVKVVVDYFKPVCSS
jgi:hypothetical protein